MGDNPSSTARRTSYAVHHSALTGASMVLNAARAAGLPSPAYVDPMPWRTTIGIATWDDFEAWATWLDATPVPDAWVNQGDRRYNAAAEIFDVDVRITAIKHISLLCPRCGHVVQQHDVIGCGDRSCRCYYSRSAAEIEAQRAVARAERQDRAVTV